MSKAPYNAFFLRMDGAANEEFVLNLRPGVTQPWFQDYTRETPALLKTKYLQPFEHWVASNLNEKYARRREKEMFVHLREEIMKKANVEWPEIVFLPQAYYVGGRQFSEAVYEYVASMILRMMGYYVIRDYQPWGTSKMPDLTAFRTPEIKEMVEMLRKRKLLKYGAVSEELQMLGLFGRIRARAPASRSQR